MSDVSPVQSPTALPMDGIRIVDGSPDEQQIAMTLSAIAYAPKGNVGPYLGNTNYYASQWSLSWGPASSLNNMAYGAWSETLNSYALVVRGADPCDVREIVDVCHQVSWMNPGTGAWISVGAYEALTDVLALQADDGSTLLDWISNVVLNTSPTAALWVTGHSLGGGIASMLAPYLVNWLAEQDVAQALHVYTFAAPTAGDGPFAALAAQAGSINNRVYNNLDIVPMAFSDLDCMERAYEPTYSCPGFLKLWIDSLRACIDEPYVQPPTVDYMLNGRLTNGSDYVSEVLLQHNHNTYLQLLNAPQVPF
jgi:hypothetical protein